MSVKTAFAPGRAIASNPARSRRDLARPSMLVLGALLLAGSLAVPERAPEPADKGPIEITDMTGRLVRLEGPARRVMTLTPTLWHYLAVEESGERLLMLAPYMRKEVDDSVMGRIFPELARIPLMTVDRRNNAPFNVEETLAMDPDLVFVWEYLSPGYDRLGVKGLVKVKSDGGDKREFYDILGGATAKSERVARLWEGYERRMGRLGAALAPPPGAEPKTIIVLANENFSLWSDNAFKRFSENLAKVGGVNLAASARPSMGPMVMEALLELDPDVIYLNFYNLSWSVLTLSDLLGDPRLQGMRAVKNRRVYHMPMGAMRLEGPVEEPLFMAWTGLTLNPEHGRSLDLRREIKDAYLEAFGHDLTEDEVDAWLRYDENRWAPGQAALARGRHAAPPGEGGGI